MRREPAGRQNGPAIRAFRKLVGLRVAQLAQYAGLQHAQTLVNIENDSRPASVATIKAIARVLGVPAEAIVRNPRDLAEDDEDEAAAA